MKVRHRAAEEAHVDDEPHTHIAQTVIVPGERGVADEEVVGDLGKIHAANIIIGYIMGAG
jgi:hypothetical protein